jgi:hypothetical protein
VIMKCLEKRPADRPQKADEIINALDTLTTPSSGTVPIAAWRRPGRHERWKNVARVGLPAAVLAAGVAALLMSRPRGTEPPATAPAAESVAVVVPPAPAPPAPPVAPPADSAKLSATGPADTLSTPKVIPPAAPPARAPSRRRPPAALSAEDSTLLARFRGEAATARSRALAAGVESAVIARGDSSVSRAESLGARRRTAEAVAQFSTAATLWTQAASERDRFPPAAVEPAAEPEPPAARPPAPVAPTPPPPRDTAAAPPADPAPQIRALFAEYGRAIESRSVDAIRKTYPGLQPQQAREWEEFFQRVNEVQVELQVTDLKVNGDAAEAGLSGVYVFANPSTHRTQHEPVSFRATLRREGGRWRIAALR